MMTATAGILYHTDPEWLDFLVRTNQMGTVNFWTYTSKGNLKPPYTGIPFFFKLPGGNIAGMATYTGLMRLTIKEMWDEYGIANGRPTLDDLSAKYKDSPYAKDGNPRLLCLILKDVIPFRKHVDVEAARTYWNVRMKYLDDNEVKEILARAGMLSTARDEVKIPSVDAKYKETLIKSRVFQGELRKLVMRRYGNSCIMCGIDNPDLLWVSHIKPVSDFPDEAGKVDNTLLLCRLHDGMFDRGLISINDDNKVIVSDILRKSTSKKLQSEVRELENAKISTILKSSREFLQWHRNNLFQRQ